MNLSAPFILRPIATALLMAGLLLCGLACLVLFGWITYREGTQPGTTSTPSRES